MATGGHQWRKGLLLKAGLLLMRLVSNCLRGHFLLLLLGKRDAGFASGVLI